MESIKNVISEKVEEIKNNIGTEIVNCVFCNSEIDDGYTWNDNTFCDRYCKDKYEEKKNIEDEKRIMGIKKQNRLKKHIEFAKICGVKERHSICTLENYIGETDFIKEWEKDRTQNILLHSQNAGSGKTHLAVALLKYIGYNYIQQYYKIYDQSRIPTNTPELLFVSSSQLMIDIRSTFDSKTKSDSDIIQELSNIPVLIIDDIGAEKVSDYVISIIYVILNNRYENTLPTIVTTNLNAEEIATYYNQRIVSRLASGVVVKLKGDDMRIRDSKKF